MSDPNPPAYDDALVLLDADHKLVKKMFIQYTGLAEDAAPPEARHQLALKICQDITVHAQVEEEIFYPAVREAVGDKLIEHAEEEHAQAKEKIAQIQGMSPGDGELDAAVKELATMIDEHVLEEREKVFLQAQYADLDLRGMVPELVARKKQLQAQGGKTKEPTKKATKKKQEIA
jgi:predicted TIM-barrel fold metal-dependent hydrolase